MTVSGDVGLRRRSIRGGAAALSAAVRRLQLSGQWSRPAAQVRPCAARRRINGVELVKHFQTTTRKCHDERIDKCCNMIQLPRRDAFRYDRRMTATDINNSDEQEWAYPACTDIDGDQVFVLTGTTNRHPDKNLITIALQDNDGTTRFAVAPREALRLVQHLITAVTLVVMPDEY